MNDQNLNSSAATPATAPATVTDATTQFEQRIQTALRDSAEHLDGRTLSRLTQARYAALDAAKARSSLAGWLGSGSFWDWKLLAPVSAAAAVVAIAVTMNTSLLTRQDASQSILVASNFSDVSAADLPDKLEIIAAEDSLEFYRDVDFYAWLEGELEEDSNATPDPSASNQQTKV